ncbi:sigma 54-interacting transcriptional regulator [Bdellovibrio svalbardensis]|uniref:Sigma 54-dependent Fis family transcriptional regulator n=1 Tax=Bdellovibrio svalbardensis TaxID=2972972 RepID=A0ABT6DJ07_9BACT|nr:sigma 54-interacting transcriptional regulator [Bdellovibrio svalbardensis]MDG0816778.1 sigma 54-dependent Fis family transcriptional regulator [Bdellovibrio svalbardensis]
MTPTTQAFLKTFGDNAKTLSVSDFATLGKDVNCQIQLDGEDIAERHCRLERKEAGFLIRDMRTSFGTFVNDAKIVEALLQEGDIIRIGSQELLFTLEKEQQSSFPLRSRNEVWHEELQVLGNVAKTDFPVLILGPSGTGKDVIASALHENSLRKNGPFMSVNCSALSETLIESELFGHIKGSFTGAINDRKGAFESARGGTLFLDEIGDLSYSLQAKLLRALENGEIRPVGADRNVKTDVRIIAATHQNLSEKIREGAFRSDLYFRLNVVNVTPPALVLRMEDFDELLYSFAKKMKVRFSFNAISRMKKHPWPGNIRELKNLVTRAAALYPRIQIEDYHIEKLLDKSLLSHAESTPANNIPVIKEIEKQMIIKRLAVNKGNQRRTALDLGMPKSTLHDRLKYYNIDLENFKA